MAAMKPMEMSLPLNIKKEKDEEMSDNDDSEETDVDDCCSISSLLQPSILDKDCFSSMDPQDEFLHLTSMVKHFLSNIIVTLIVRKHNGCMF